jgi:Ulp1 family protease
MGNQLDLTCKICNLECHSEADFLNHMEGKKHKKKVAKHDRNSASANHDLSDKSRGNNEKISLKSSKSIEEDYRNANHQKPLHKKGDENTFLIYPSADANDAVTIKIEDLRRLRPGAKLNDSIIDFWMRVMWENLDEKNKKYHQYFQTYFFQTIQKESIKKWTLRRKYSIFESNFLHIPINYADHWVVIVLCNLSTLIRNSKQPFSEEMTDGVANDPSPCILFMDSLGIKHGKELSSTLEVEKKIYSYLAQEYNSKKKKRGIYNFIQFLNDAAHPCEGSLSN